MQANNVEMVPQRIEILIGDRGDDDGAKHGILREGRNRDERIVEAVCEDDREKGDEKLFPATSTPRNHPPEGVPRDAGERKALPCEEVRSGRLPASTAARLLLEAGQ